MKKIDKEEDNVLKSSASRNLDFKQFPKEGTPEYDKFKEKLMNIIKKHDEYQKERVVGKDEYDMTFNI